MAAFVTNHHIAAQNTGRISATITKFANTLTTWNDARNTRNALAKLSARELDDIGLTFADLDAIHTLTR